VAQSIFQKFCLDGLFQWKKGGTECRCCSVVVPAFFVAPEISEGACAGCYDLMPVKFFLSETEFMKTTPGTHRSIKSKPAINQFLFS